MCETQRTTDSTLTRVHDVINLMHELTSAGSRRIRLGGRAGHPPPPTLASPGLAGGAPAWTLCVSAPSPAKVSVSGDGSSQPLAKLELPVLTSSLQLSSLARNSSF